MVLLATWIYYRRYYAWIIENISSIFSRNYKPSALEFPENLEETSTDNTYNGQWVMDKLQYGRCYDNYPYAKWRVIVQIKRSGPWPKTCSSQANTVLLIDYLICRLQLSLYFLLFWESRLTSHCCLPRATFDRNSASRSCEGNLK